MNNRILSKGALVCLIIGFWMANASFNALRTAQDIYTIPSYLFFFFLVLVICLNWMLYPLLLYIYKILPKSMKALLTMQTHALWTILVRIGLVVLSIQQGYGVFSGFPRRWNELVVFGSLIGSIIGLTIIYQMGVTIIKEIREKLRTFSMTDVNESSRVGVPEVDETVNGPGIYAIKAYDNSGRLLGVYIGESINIINRWERHKLELMCRKHHNHALQDCYDDFRNLEFYVLHSFPEQIDDLKVWLHKMEKFYWIQASEMGHTLFSDDPLSVDSRFSRRNESMNVNFYSYHPSANAIVVLEGGGEYYSLEQIDEDSAYSELKKWGRKKRDYELIDEYERRFM